MAEIVETDFFQSVVFQYNLEMLCDEVWFDKFAHCIYIDIIQIFFAVLIINTSSAWRMSK